MVWSDQKTQQDKKKELLDINNNYYLEKVESVTIVHIMKQCAAMINNQLEFQWDFFEWQKRNAEKCVYPFSMCLTVKKRKPDDHGLNR